MKRATATWGLLALVLLVPGCAGWRQKVQTPTVSEKREDRAADAVRAFEQHRDTAQLEAALERWNQADFRRAEEMLVAILNRRPDYVEARFRLAEVLWSHGDPAAEPHLRTVLEAQPNRAEVHHALGLVLDGAGRVDEARHHLVKAAELEPDNEVYRQTCETLVQR
jgi:Flp pilus assembly protein TadD